MYAEPLCTWNTGSLVKKLSLLGAPARSGTVVYTHHRVFSNCFEESLWSSGGRYRKDLIGRGC